MDAAAVVLAQRGFAGARLSDVAERAGVQTASIYYYFPSRQMLIEAVVLEGTRRTYEYVKARVDELGERVSALARIERAVASHLRMVLELSDYSIASIQTSGQLPDEIRSKQVILEAAYGDFWRQLLSDGRASGEVRPDLEPFAARMLIMGMLNWASEWWNSQRWPIDTVIETATQVVITGLCPAN
jgi:AcrR family transcriptional regulator